MPTYNNRYVTAEFDGEQSKVSLDLETKNSFVMRLEDQVMNQCASSEISKTDITTEGIKIGEAFAVQDTDHSEMLSFR